jgi:hypothetical protein
VIGLRKSLQAKDLKKEEEPKLRKDLETSLVDLQKLQGRTRSLPK